MVKVTRENGRFILEPLRWHKFWTFKRRLEVPFSAVVSARRDPTVMGRAKGFRLLGTHLPGVIVAGRFYRQGEHTFWDVCHPEQAVVIDLQGEKFKRLIVEVDDPDAVVAMLTQG